MNISHPKSVIQVRTDPLTCCQTESSPSLKNVDIICRIAIGIFSLSVLPVHFLISFGAGLIGGTVDFVVRTYRNQSMVPNGQSKPVCAQGYMDFLSGVRFSPLAATLATAAFIMEHVRHDPQFYAPFCGLFLGFWTGREGAFLCHNLAGRICKMLSHSC